MIGALRLRSGRAREKALAIISEVLADLSWSRFVLIAGNRDGSQWTVVPGQMTGQDLADAMLAGAHGVQQFAQNEKRLAKVGMPVRIDVSERGDGPPPNASPDQLKRECRIAPSGAIEAPPGEAFVFCGQCGGSRFYATAQNTPGGPTRRLCCIGCGNEVAVHRVTAEAGHA